MKLFLLDGAAGAAEAIEAVCDVVFPTSVASLPAVNDCASGLGCAGRLKLSEPEPLRAEAADSLLGVKLKDGVLPGLAGGAWSVFEGGTEVVFGVSRAKLGGALDCVAPSAGFPNEPNDAPDVCFASESLPACDVNDNEGGAGFSSEAAGAADDAKENLGAGLSSDEAAGAAVGAGAKEKLGDAGLSLDAVKGEVVAGDANENFGGSGLSFEGAVAGANIPS